MSLKKLTDLWYSYDVTIAIPNKHVWFVDDARLDAVYNILLQLQKHNGEQRLLELDKMIYIMNKHYEDIEESCNADDTTSFLDFPQLKQMLKEGVALGDKLTTELTNYWGFVEVCNHL